MYRIALCDDEVLLSSDYEEKIESYFKGSSLTIEIDIFSSGESLLKHVKNQQENYQMIFLDIEMNGMNGIEVAKKIRTMDNDVLICYLTSYTKYTLESFEVSPFRYLLKPLTQDMLTVTLDAAVEEIEDKRNYLFVKIGKMQHQLSQRAIILIRSELGRKLNVQLENDEELSFYGKLTAIEEQLNHLFFAKVNQGTIVNMRFIDRIEDDLIVLKNNEFISISRRQKKHFRFLYSKFIKKWVGM
ncbi:LytR/AlgR family response regulator transcription factor [Enterococcus termitis]|uniref:DNA-binding response regulator n=1 Tax=Enterococcus termitis TaxID=332950 RepID=A0A1E5GCV3_9ENTE|nr:LytTR family DNA-binding domain-containing protein [Enterococcus termitis]OEG10522.1 hypothetical protein BCR25_08590 [Enterococcus termitis]OJG97515.1 hypothetical protein RV18_GL000796 [Enterococcus termitis]